MKDAHNRSPAGRPERGAAPGRMTKHDIHGGGDGPAASRGRARTRSRARIMHARQALIRRRGVRDRRPAHDGT